jgi:hypothetical protein
MPERTLWAAVLVLLLEDGLSHWRGEKCVTLDLEQAFDDVMRCGPMLRRCCEHLEVDLVWISDGFIRWPE